MFLVIPLTILIASLIVLGWLVGRKFVYLKKLSPDIVERTAAANGNGHNFWAEFFPGLAVKLEAGKWRQHKFSFLAEFEKFLRKFRLVSLKLDTSVNKLIQRIRNSLIYHEKLVNGSIQSAVEIQGEPEVKPEITTADKIKAWKEEEQRLIIEIAKSPKDAELYKELGKIYIKTGEVTDAAESFEKALELDPGDDSIRSKLEKAKKKLEKNMPA